MTTDLVHKAANHIEHNRYTWAGAAVLVASVALATGCQVKVANPFGEGQVDSYQLGVIAEQRRATLDAKLQMLQGEAVVLEAVAGAAQDEIQRQTNKIRAVLESIGKIVAAQAGPLAGPLLAALGIGASTLAGGTLMDNRRKGELLKKNKQAQKQQPAG